MIGVDYYPESSNAPLVQIGNIRTNPQPDAVEHPLRSQSPRR